MQGKNEDDGKDGSKAKDISRWAKDKGEGGNACTVVVLVTTQVEDAQGEYTYKDKGWIAWVVVIPAQGENPDNGEDNCKAKNANTWINNKGEDKISNACIIIVPPVRCHGRYWNPAVPQNSVN